MDKRAELLALVRLRKATRWPAYKCIGDYHKGAYECDFVSPYTKTAGNVDAEIMVMLQDWASDDVLRGPFHEPSATLGHDPSRPTNKNLIKLLNMTFGVTLRDTYGTNLFPFVKLGGMSEPIPQGDLIAAALQFALPQILIVKPKLVICLGLVTFKALREVCRLSPSQDLHSAIESPFNIGTTRVWCQAHTGRLSNRGGFEVVLADWSRMKENVRGEKAFRRSDLVQTADGDPSKSTNTRQLATAQRERPHGLRVVSATLPLRHTRTIFMAGEDEIARYDHKSKNTWAKIIAYDKTLARKAGHDITGTRIVTKELCDGKFVAVEP
jgi:hypothetical protein